MESCYGCGIRAVRHPIVAVMTMADVEEEVGELKPSARGFVDVPICSACHNDPAHRTRVIKGHFFVAAQAESAVRAAGSASLGG